MVLLKGKVDWFNDRKGFGFVSSPSLTGPVMLHYSALNLRGRSSIEPGESISFTLREARNGPRVEEVFFGSELKCLAELHKFLDAVVTLSEVKANERLREAIENAFFAQPFGEKIENETVIRFLSRFPLQRQKDFINDFVFDRFLQLEKELFSRKVEALEKCDLLANENPEKARSLRASILSFNPERTKMEAKEYFINQSKSRLRF